jgi:hypothetical protein
MLPPLLILLLLLLPPASSFLFPSFLPRTPPLHLSPFDAPLAAPLLEALALGVAAPAILAAGGKKQDSDDAGAIRKQLEEKIGREIEEK